MHQGKNPTSGIRALGIDLVEERSKSRLDCGKVPNRFFLEHCFNFLVFVFGDLIVISSSSIKVNFGKFDGKGNFSLWQQRMKNLLV